MTNKQDLWNTGNLYEKYMGRWSRLVADEFLKWLSIPKDRDWLDVGCGTGALTQTILMNAAPRIVKGIDPSAGFIKYAMNRIVSSLVSLEVGDAQSLPVDSASFDAVVSGLALNHVPEPSRAVAEMARASRPGGLVAAYVWDYAGKMELLRHLWDAAVALDPAALEFDQGRRFPICTEDSLRELFVRARLRGVEVRPIDIPTHFRDFDDYWSPFLSGEAPAPGYVMSLSESRRIALRDSLRTRLPVSVDGSIQLIARAWGIRGTAPS